MSAQPQPQLPPGWQATWDQNAQRYYFVHIESGTTQWEPPVAVASPPAPISPLPAGGPGGVHHAARKRQYAAGQTQAYLGTPSADPGMGYAQPPPGDGYAQQQQPGPVPQPGGQFFTPGLPDDPAAQAAQQPQMQQPAYYAGQQQQQQQGGVDQLANQFGQMGMGAPQGQKPFQLHTVNLVGMPIDPRELLADPPEIRLPPGACISNNPFANADPSYQRSTLNAIPTTHSLLNKSRLPFALILTPYRSLKEQDDDLAPPVVSDTVIVRCRRCRTYINPYVTFIDGGNRWKCCMCGLANDVPQLFDWDQQRGQPADRWARPELNYATVEYIAPSEYMVRPPQPPVYVFLIDVSYAAVQSGMVATATRTILESLDRLPNVDDRTKVAVIAYDVTLHFFSLPPGSTESRMLVVGDLDDVYLPQPSDILVNLTESRSALDTLLGKLSDMFQDNHAVGSAFGPALQAGFKLASPTGGKLIALSANLPSLGPGALKNREDPKLLGTSQESKLLQPQSSFYKTFAIECSRSQVSVDLFLTGSGYSDVATVSGLPRYTSGQTYFYPSFNASRSEDAIKLAHELSNLLASPIGLEAVIRVRASRGLRMSQFHGNFFVRSTDLLALPAVPWDQSYAIEMQIEETLNQPFVVLQTAVLHTSSFGERRIRVVTQALPTTQNISEVYSSADQVAIATLLANKAVERSLSNKIEDARDAVMNKMSDILGAYKTNMTAAGSGASAQLSISENLKLLPILLLGLMKHVGLRHSAQIPSDLRAYAHCLLTTLPPQLLIPYIHPCFYSLHNMPPECGTIGEHGVIMPPPLPLTSERLERHGLYLIEDGQTMFLWVGRDAVPQLVKDVFDLPAYDQLRGGKATLPILDNPFNQRVNAVIAKTREMRRTPYWPHLYVVKEDGEPPLRLWALSALIMDRADQTPSYVQFLTQLKDRVNGGSFS
ncbi:hypothetical protein CALCODRAFT_491881 [Calocera cornea HHB12733]|uniref:WW domain-containing protein n=1 Tax=Calocera cornea HHB12733 TaxID=1353952 RepID=A0A165IT23_9BASI|nr:hypothetical protein CALCODRAFT_491881 [Calocera cornea HHB12733]